MLASLAFRMYTQLQFLDQQEHQLVFYTDGSCQHPRFPTVRYAGFSIVLDLAATDAERLAQLHNLDNGLPIATLAPVVAARTPGAQGIYRAELFAITYICERFQHASIYTDSQSALHTLAKIQSCTSLAVLEGLPEFDLVQRLWLSLQTGTRHFYKVTAHAEDEVGLDPLTRYHRQGNKLANDTAIAATRGITPIFAEQLEATALEVKQQHELLHNLYEFHLEAFAYRANLHAQWKRDEQHEAEDAERTRRDVHALCCAYSLTEVWTPPNQGLTMLQESAWGNTLATVMLDWMRSVEWPVRPDQHEFQSAGISWYELVVSFMYFSKIYFPLRCPGPNGSEVLRVLGSDAEVIALNQKFSDFANTFAIFFKQVTDLVQFPAWPTVERGLVRSLYLQGATIFTSGFRWRPVIPYQVEVATVFQGYLRLHKGQSFSEVPPLCIQVNKDRQQRVQRELLASWLSRTMRYRASAKTMRNHRHQPQPTLDF